MKKFLSLVLALVMTMSLVTVSAGAKDFTDSSKIQYAEAVDVMSAVKVIDGYADGSFNPSATLTRGAAAKIICNLILGPTTASALVADAAPYKDVPTNHTFAGYIAYCQKTGIISGYADGTFKPANSLTGYAFMKMLLGALGYKAENEGYTGANWSINVAKRALNVGLSDDLVGDFNGVKAVNREEACLYAFNTLKATMVEYEKNSTVTVGNITIKEQSDAKDMANTGKTDGNIDKDGKMQFAEKYFTDLKGVATTDEFSRPATMWKVKSEEIGTYTDTADATYTKKVEIGDIYKDLGLGKSISAKKVSVYVDGVENPDQPARDITKGDDKNKYGDNGVLTEVFYDNDNDSVIITEVNTYVGTITKTVKATDKKDAYVVVAPESEKPTNFKNEFETDDKFEDDDYVLYTYSLKEKEIESVAAATKVEGTVTVAENSVTNNSDKKALTINGTKYKASAKISGENLSDVSVKQDYTIYLDSYGYMIYVEENEAIGDYALILNIKGGSDWYLGNRVELLFTDGTTKIVTTDKDYNAKKGMVKHDIVTYKVNADGEYTLKALPTEKLVSAKSSMNGQTLTNETLSMENNKAGLKINGTTYTANSASVFVVADAGSTDDFTAYTGVKNAPSINTTKAAKLSETADTYAYCKSGKMITVMFVFPGKDVEINDATSNALFVANGSVSNLIHDNDGDYFTFSAVVDGELKTVKVAQDVKVDGVKQTEKQIKKNFGGLFKSYTTDKGIITSVKTYADYENYQDVEDESAVNGTVSGIDKVSKEYTVKLGLQKNGEYKYTVTVDKDAKIFYVNTDDEISVSSYSAIAKDDNDVVYAVVKDYMVKTLIVYEQDGNADPVKPDLSKDVEVKSVKVGPTTEITYYVEAGEKELSVSDIKAILTDKGCTDISVNGYGEWSFTYDGMKFTEVDVVTTQVYAVSVKYSNDSTVATSNVKLVAKNGVITVTVKNADGSAFAGTYTGADVKGAAGTVSNFEQAKDNKSAKFDFTFSGLDKDVELVVTLK